MLIANAHSNHACLRKVVALPRDLRFAREELTSQKLDLIIYPEVGS